MRHCGLTRGLVSQHRHARTQAHLISGCAGMMVCVKSKRVRHTLSVAMQLSFCAQLQNVSHSSVSTDMGPRAVVYGDQRQCACVYACAEPMLELMRRIGRQLSSESTHIPSSWIGCSQQPYCPTPKKMSKAFDEQLALVDLSPCSGAPTRACVQTIRSTYPGEPRPSQCGAYGSSLEVARTQSSCQVQEPLIFLKREAHPTHGEARYPRWSLPSGP